MNLKQFLELFNPYPGNTYLEVSTGVSELTQALKELLESTDGNLDLVIYNDTQEDLKTDFPNSKIQQLQSFEKPFRALPRSADIVILKDVFSQHKKQDAILKTSYSALANTADIIIMEKKGILDKPTMYQLLEEYEFRATNFIDIVEGYDLVMAKKMHMWGNGL